jgi:hypothetical protein
VQAQRASAIVAFETTQRQVDALCEAFARTVREKSSRLAALALVRGFFWNDFDPAAFTSIG